MISDSEKGEEHVQESIHGNPDHPGVEAVGGWAKGRRRGTGSGHTIYAWKAKYGGMDVSQAQEAKQLAVWDIGDHKNLRGTSAVEKMGAWPPWKTLRVSNFPTVTAAMPSATRMSQYDVCGNRGRSEWKPKIRRCS
jgi:hypothetical protein